MASTGNVFPGTGESVDRAGLTAWTSPGNVTADDAADATCNGAGSDYLVARNFDLSAVPDGATIVGVTVRVEASEHSGGTEALLAQMQDAAAALTGTAKSTSNEGNLSGTGKAVYTYGGTADVWGATLTPAIVKDPDFGVRLWFATSHDVRIDFVTLAIEYQEAVTGSGAATAGATAAGAGSVRIAGTGAATAGPTAAATGAERMAGEGAAAAGSQVGGAGEVGAVPVTGTGDVAAGATAAGSGGVRIAGAGGAEAGATAAGSGQERITGAGSGQAGAAAAGLGAERIAGTGVAIAGATAEGEGTADAPSGGVGAVAAGATASGAGAVRIVGSGSATAGAVATGAGPSEDAEPTAMASLGGGQSRTAGCGGGDTYGAGCGTGGSGTPALSEP